MLKRLLNFILVGILMIVVAGFVRLQYDRAQVPATTTNNNAAASVRPSTPITAAVQRGELVVSVNASGQIQPNQKAALAFATTGRVATLNVSQGDHVLKGQIIATLDNTMALDALLLAQARINTAQIPLHRLTDAPRQVDVNMYKAALSLAQASLKAAQGSVDRIQAKIAAVSVDTAKNALWLQQLTRDADKKLKDDLLANPRTKLQANALPPDTAENGSLTAKDYDVQIAQANADAANQQTGNVGAIAAAQEQVTVAQNALDKLLEGGNKDDIARVQASLDGAQAAFAQAKAALDKNVLVAPFDGVIAQLNLNLGEPTPQVPAALLLDTQTFYVDLPISEVDIAQISVGQEAKLRFTALPHTVLNGKVTRIGGSGTSAGGVITYTVRVEIDPADKPLLPSMTTSVSIVISKAPNALLVPVRFVNHDASDDKTYVTVQHSDGTTRKTAVVTGLQNDRQIEITSGLSAGDVIVLADEATGQAQ